MQWEFRLEHQFDWYKLANSQVRNENTTTDWGNQNSLMESIAVTTDSK